MSRKHSGNNVRDTLATACGDRHRHPSRRLLERRTGMRLTPSEQEKLLLSVAGMVARERRTRGVKLNAPEATALLACWVLEAARDGRSVEELMHAGREVLRRDEVMNGVPELVDEVQVEATFPDGRKLVTLHQPIL
jgi:urease subunit gamma